MEDYNKVGFKLESKYKPTGDQPQAIEKLVDGIKSGLNEQVLLGVTGSGKTFVMANIIEKIGKPTLVIAHNKTLAYQLYTEFKNFFPNNHVEYFISYYDFYQPEAYIVDKDMYVEKKVEVNSYIEMCRTSAISSVLHEKDVIVVASVSCIYGLGNPDVYDEVSIRIEQGQTMERNKLIKALTYIQYTRNDIEFERSTFRVRGDIVDIYPSNYKETAIKVEFFGDEIENIFEFDVLTGKKLYKMKNTIIYPASNYVVSGDLSKEIARMKLDFSLEKEEFLKKNKLVEADRLENRFTEDITDIEMHGYCNGIENYSRYFDGRMIGEPPYTLLDYFKGDFLVFIDESHITIPQIGGMYEGDRSRKENLVNYGFRLKSAYDNRPLKFEEFNKKLKDVIYVSATPKEYELSRSGRVAECLIRPTGLVDPEVIVRSKEDQLTDLISEIQKVKEDNGRVLVTTLTKKMSESLNTFFKNNGLKSEYLHSDVETNERTKIINDLRRGKFDIIVGINLLREGLDIPEVQLVAILDADKTGFLRSSISLIQTIGRASRNVKGRVIMYADETTKAMEIAINETNRRRMVQMQYNKENNIIPKTIIKEIPKNDDFSGKEEISEDEEKFDKDKIMQCIDMLKNEMKIASQNLDFEMAITCRDEIEVLTKKLDDYRKEIANERKQNYFKHRK